MSSYERYHLEVFSKNSNELNRFNNFADSYNTPSGYQLKWRLYGSYDNYKYDKYEQEMIEISKQYPDIIFVLTIEECFKKRFKNGEVKMIAYYF